MCYTPTVVDGFPYLGKDYERPNGESLPDHVVKTLVKDQTDTEYEG